MIPDNVFNDVIEEIAGHDIINLVNAIKGKSNVSEFKIADKLKVSVNKVRNMLYRLDAYSLVDSARKKDKKKGWYVYYWTLDLIKLRDLAVRIKKNKINLMKERIVKEEQVEFFICPDKHIRISLENAMEYNFRCPECDLQLQREDNTKVINSLKKQIEKLSQEVQLLKSLDIKHIVEKKLTKVKKKSKKRTKKMKKKLSKKKNTKKKKK